MQVVEVELDPGETNATVFRQFDEATDTTVTISLVDEEGGGFSETVRVQTAEDDDNISLVSADINGVQGNSSFSTTSFDDVTAILFSLTFIASHFPRHLFERSTNNL